MIRENDVNIEEGLLKSEADIDVLDEDPLALPELQPASPSCSSTHKPYLHGLRGLAAFIVYTGHWIAWWYGPGGPIEHGFGYHGEMMFGTFPFIRTFFTGGSAAVHIFFVLSGYVLSVSSLRKIQSGHQVDMNRGLASAFIRRPFRLFIPLAGVSLTLALVMHLPFGLAPELSWPQPLPTVWLELGKWFVETTKMMNPLKLTGIGEPWFPYDPPAWTMSAEYKGSLAVFLALGVCSVLPATIYRAALFAAIGIVMLFVREWVVACFMAGMVLAVNDMEHLPSAFTCLSSKARKITHNILFVTAWWTLCQPTDPDPKFAESTPGWYYVTKMTPSNYYTWENWRFWNTIGAILLVYSISNLKWTQSFLSWRIMQFLGKISFSLYLAHMPFMWTIGDRICRVLGVQRGDFKTWWDNRLQIPDVGPKGLSTGFLLSQMIILPLNILIALAAYKLLDQPGVNVGHWIVEKLRLGKRPRMRKIVKENGAMVQYSALPSVSDLVRLSELPSTYQSGYR